MLKERKREINRVNALSGIMQGRTHAYSPKAYIFKCINLKSQKEENVTQLWVKSALNCICLQGENERQDYKKQEYKKQVTGVGEVSESRPDKMFSQYLRFLHFLAGFKYMQMHSFAPLTKKKLVCYSRLN